MSVNYILNNIYDYIRRYFGINTKVTKIEESRYYFDLGNNCAFVLNTDAFNTEADINAFVLDLSTRLRKACVSA